MTVSTAMDYATGGQSAVVVADDTDIFVMLLCPYYDRSNDGLAAVFLKKERSFPYRQCPHRHYNVSISLGVFYQLSPPSHRRGNQSSGGLVVQ